MSRTTVINAVRSRTVATAVAAFTVAAAGGLAVFTTSSASALTGTQTISKVGFDGRLGAATVAARGPMDASAVRDAVHVLGTGFAGATTADVDFNDVDAADVLVVSDTELWAVPPAYTGGTTTADDKVTVKVGTASSVDAYEYKATPTITNSGVAVSADSRNLEISGTNLGEAFAVTVNGPTYTGTLPVLRGATATKISAKIPPAMKKGTYVVGVLTPWGNATQAYTYGVVPVIRKLSVAKGTMLGGTTVRVTGLNLAGINSVQVDTQTVSAADVIQVSATEVIFTTPAFAGTPDTRDPSTKRVKVVLANDTGNSKGADFTYVGLPTLTTTSFSGGDAHGPLGGGETLTLNGTFLSGASVLVDSVAATVNKAASSATQVVFKTPRGKSTGAKTVAVKTRNGTVLFAGDYTYNVAMTFVSVTPDSVSAATGGTVTLTGTNFTSNSVVHVGTLSTNVAAATTYVSGTSLTAVVPAGAKGSTYLFVKDPDRGVTVAKAYRRS